MYFRQIEDPFLAQYAYLIGCQQTGEAIIIDPERDIDRYLIAVYKAMGGGWQIRLGKDFIPEQTLEVMRNRTDWGKILDSELPEEQQDLPTGKDVNLFHKPKW